MTRAVAFGLLLACCTFSRDKREDSSLREHEHAEVRAEQAQTETKTEGPETITTTVEEYEAEEPPQVPAGPQAAAAQEGSQHPDGRPAPVRPLLIKRTVVVDQRGPVLDVKRESASETGSEDIGLDMTKHTLDDESAKPALAGYLWMALAALGVAGAGWVAYRFTPWWRALAALL